MYECGAGALTVRTAEHRVWAAPGVSDLWARAVPITAQVLDDGIVRDLVAVRVSIYVVFQVDVFRDGVTEDAQKAGSQSFDSEVAFDNVVFEVVIGRRAPQRG